MRGRRPALPAGDLDATAAATVLDGDDLRRRHATVPDAIAALPGFRVQRLGGFGAPVLLGVRGSTAEQTTAFIDGIPITSLDGSSLDLAELLPAGIERLEVYRSATPGALGLQAIGGALRIQTRSLRRPLAEATLGGGSFGARLAEVAAGGSVGSLHAFAAARWLDADGDHPYRSDGGTAFEPSDDATRTRRNNGLARLGGTFALDGAWSGWRLGGRWVGNRLDQGVPGSVRNEALDAHVQTTRHLGWVSAERTGLWRTDDTLTLVAQGSARDTVVDDRLGELGLPWHARHTVTAGLAQVHWRTPLAGPLHAEARATAATGRIEGQDLRGGGAEPVSNRTTLGAGVALPLRFEGPDFEVAPSVAVERHDDQRMTNVGFPFGWRAVADTDATLWGARLGAGWQPVRWLHAVGAVQRGTRAPALTELFGDGAVVRANPSLRPETALGADLGLTLRADGRPGWAAAQAVAFVQHVTDLVQLETTGPHQAMHRNVASATVRGLELEALVGWRRDVTASFSHATLQTQDASGRPAYDGKPLPLRPRSRWRGRFEVVRAFGSVQASAWAELTWQAGYFLDPANLVAVAPRTLAGSGGRIEHLASGLWCDIAIDDITDADRVDLIGWPLPGRTLLARLGWRGQSAAVPQSRLPTDVSVVAP